MLKKERKKGNKRTKEETVALFSMYAEEFQMQANRAQKEGRENQFYYFCGKADAYGMAVFEMTRNMEG